MFRRSGWNFKELSTQHQLVGAVAVGEQAIVANTMEAVGKHVEQKPTHELARVKPHDLGFVVAVLPVILPAKTDMLVGEIEQPAVADGDAVGIAGQIGKHLSRSCERTLGVDHPLALAQRREISPERFLVRKPDKIGTLVRPWREPPPDAPRTGAGTAATAHGLAGRIQACIESNGSRQRRCRHPARCNGYADDGRGSVPMYGALS
jgi:hypothetical protein